MGGEVMVIGSGGGAYRFGEYGDEKGGQNKY